MCNLLKLQDTNFLLSLKEDKERWGKRSIPSVSCYNGDIFQPGYQKVSAVKPGQWFKFLLVYWGHPEEFSWLAPIWAWVTALQTLMNMSNIWIFPFLTILCSLSSSYRMVGSVLCPLCQLVCLSICVSVSEPFFQCSIKFRGEWGEGDLLLCIGEGKFILELW